MVCIGWTSRGLRGTAGVNKRSTGLPEFYCTGERTMQLERYLIEHCAPTLASLKAGSLICLKETVEGELDRQIHTWNARLREKGLVLMALRRPIRKAEKNGTKITTLSDATMEYMYLVALGSVKLSGEYAKMFDYFPVSYTHLRGDDKRSVLLRARGHYTVRQYLPDAGR